MPEADLIHFIQRDGGVLKVNVFGFFQSHFPVGRDLIIPFDGSQYAARGRWIAIRILSCTGSDPERFAEVALSIQQSQHYVCRIDLGINIERTEYAFSAGDVA